MGLPASGEASTYSDYFVGKLTSSGDMYFHDKYTAALLPKSRWHAVALGTRVQVSYKGRKVVVKVNDRGKGNGEKRVLDLSRAAMEYLVGKLITDKTASVIQLSDITVVDSDTPLGPVKP